MDSLQLVSYLEKTLNEQKELYVKKISETRKQNLEEINSYRATLQESLKRIIEMLDPDTFADSFAFEPMKIRNHLAKSAHDYKTLIDKLQTVEKQAFIEYKREAESAVSKIIEPTAKMILGRSRQLSELSCSNQENLTSLEEELKLVNEMEAQMSKMKQRAPNNSIVKTFYQRKHELETSIQSLSITFTPLYYPVPIIPGDNISTIIYAYPAEGSLCAKLIDCAVKSALRNAGAQNIQQGNSSHFRRYVNFSCNGQDICALIQKELEKPEYKE